MSVPPIPPNAQIVVPYMVVRDADGLLRFLEEAFGAVCRSRLVRPEGSVMHMDVDIGGSALMMGEADDDVDPHASMLFLRVEDCDAVYARAVDCGAESVMEPADMSHAGERYGGVRDPAGNVWWIATHIEDVDPEEEQRRIDAWGATVDGD